MSPSERPATVLLTIDVPTDVETVLLDAELQERARSIGRSEQRLSPGIYKVKFRRGTRTADSVLMLSAGATAQSVQLPQELAGTTRAEDPAAAEHHRRVLEAARDASVAVQGTLGHGSQLMVFVGADSPAEEVRPRSLALYRGKTRLWDYAGLWAPPPTPLPWWGANLALSPGAYTLRLGGGRDGALEQTVFLPRDWQLQVFLRWAGSAWNRRPGASSSEAAAPSSRGEGCILAGGAAILLARSGMGFVPTSGALELAETVRTSMGPARVRFAQSLDERLLDRWLDEKVGNPMLGLFAVHAMRMAAERNPDAMRDREGLIGTVLDRMTRWIGRHPDVDALRMHFGKLPVADFDSDVLPMLMASYELVRDRVLERDAANPKRSAYERAVGALWGNGPWLMWREKALSASKRTAATEDASAAALKSVAEAVSSPDAVERLEGESLSSVDSAIVALLAGSSKAANRRPRERRTSEEGTARPQAASGPEGISSTPQTAQPSSTGMRVGDVAYAIPDRRQIATQLGLPQSLVDDRLAALHGLVEGGSAPARKGVAHPVRLYPGTIAFGAGAELELHTDRIYMTSAGIERLRADVLRIDNIDLADCMAEIDRIQAHGELTKSTEYRAAKEKQAVLLARSATLKGMLNRALKISPEIVRTDAVSVGTRVKIWLPGGKEETYTLLGPTDVDEAHGIVDYGAPIGRALLGLKVGDTVKLPTSAGIQSARVRAIDAARLEDE